MSQGHRSSDTCLMCWKSHQKLFIECNWYPIRFGSCFEGSLEWRSGTMFYPFRRRVCRKRYAELHAPKDWPEFLCCSRSRIRFPEYLGKPYSSLSSWKYNEILLEWATIQFWSFDKFIKMTLRLMERISQDLLINLRILSKLKWKWYPWI